jgi:predicted RNA-binding Zn ribbon-like protein
METPEHIRSLRIVGGNLALDFINTQSGPPNGEPDLEALHDYADLVAWGRYAGLLTDGEVERLLRRARRRPAEAREMFERAMRLRATLDELFRAVARGEPPSERVIARLGTDEAEALGHGAFSRSGAAFQWRWPPDDLGRPIWPVVHAGVGLLSGGRFDRVKGCGGCRFLFLDETKNESRRWCSMKDCGTDAKVRNYVARRAARREASRSGAAPRQP